MSANCLIITFHYNRDDFIYLQKKTFDKFMNNKFHYVVFSDARPDLMDTLYGKPSDEIIKNTCEKLEIEHIAIPQEIHQGDLRAGIWKHMDCLDWAVRNYPNIYNYDYIWISDSDTFLLEKFDIQEYMKGYDFAGMPIFAGHVKYYRPQLIIYPVSLHNIFIQYKMRTDYMIEGQHPDGCGSLYLMFKKYPELKIKNIMETFYQYNADKQTLIPFPDTCYTHQQVIDERKNLTQKNIYPLLYTDQPGFPTYTKEEHRTFISKCHLPTHIEEYIDEIHTLSSNEQLSHNDCMKKHWDWRGNYFDGLKFYHYSEGSNWDNKPPLYHIKRSEILTKLINKTIQNN